MLFAGFSVSNGDLTLLGIVAAGRARQPGRLLDRLRGRLLRPPRPAREEQADPHQPQAPEMGRRLVRALRRRDRLLLPDAADRPHLHLAAGRGREDAVLALHRADRCSARIPWVLAAGPDRRSGRRQLGGVAPPPQLPRLRWSSRRSSPASSTCSSGAGAAAARRGRPTSRPAEPRLERGERRGSRPRRALALGVVQGPAELLPVSSSAHIVLVPWLAGWDWDEIDPEVRKSFEVALHAGAAAALLIGQRRLIAEELRAFDGRRALAPRPLLPARRRSSATRSSGRSSGGSAGRGRPPIGLLAGAAAMLVADRRPQRRGRGEADAGRRPGARRRPGGGAGARASPATASPSPPPAGARFSRDQANLLSRTIALPIIVGATVAQGRAPAPPRRRPGAAPLAGDRRRRLLRLDPRLPAPDPPGRARPRALALRRLPGRPRRRRSCEAAAVRPDEAMTDAYAKAGVDQGAADSAVAGAGRARWARSTSAGPRGRCRCPATTRA